MSNLVGSLIVGISADSSKLEQGISNAEKRMRNFGSSAMSLGTGLTASITAPLLGIGVAAITASTTLNEKMANVASLDIATERVLELKATVQDLAVETGKGTSDIADGLYQVISAFGDTGDTAKILEINAKGAAAGLATTKDAIDLTSAITKGYGDTSAEAVQKVTDLALTTVVLGQTTFPELASSIGSVTPLASALNVSMEEMFGVMATTTGVTGNTSEVATQLRGTLQSLMAPTTSMQGLMNKLGYSSGEAMVESMGLQGAINAIVAEAERTGEPLQKYIGSIEGQTLAMQLAGPSAEKLTENIKAMGNSAGATDKAFSAQTEGVNSLGFKWEQLKVKVGTIAEKLGDQLVPAFEKVLDNVTPLLEKVAGLVTDFSNLDPEVQKNALAFTAGAVALGPLVLGIGSLATGIAGAATAIGLILSPLGLVVFALIGFAFAWYYNWGGIKDKTKIVVDWLTTAWEKLSEWFTTTLPAAIVGLKTSWNQTWAQIFLDYQTAENLLVTGWTLIVSWLKVKIVSAFTNLRDDAKTKWVAIKDAITAPLATVTDTLSSMSTWITDTLPDSFTSLKNFLSGFTISNPFSGMGGWLDDIKSDIDWLLANFPLLNNLTGEKSGGRSVVTGKTTGADNVGMNAAFAGGITVTINVDKISNDIDIETLAYKVTDRIKRART